MSTDQDHRQRVSIKFRILLLNIILRRQKALHHFNHLWKRSGSRQKLSYAIDERRKVGFVREDDFNAGLLCLGHVGQGDAVWLALPEVDVRDQYLDAAGGFEHIQGDHGVTQVGGIVAGDLRGNRHRNGGVGLIENDQSTSRHDTAPALCTGLLFSVGLPPHNRRVESISERGCPLSSAGFPILKPSPCRPVPDHRVTPGARNADSSCVSAVWCRARGWWGVQTECAQ